MDSPLPQVTAEGFSELDAQLDRLSDAVRGTVLRGAVRKAIQPALAQAKATIPVGTRVHKTYAGREVSPGFSQRSVRIRVGLSKDRRMAFALLGVKAEAFYALNFVEFGVPTRQIAARPWLVPAMRNTRQQQVDALRAALEDLIKKAARKGKK